MLLLSLVLHIGAVILLFASPTEYLPGRDEIASVPRVPWTPPAPTEGTQVCYKVIAALLLFRLELHMSSGKFDFCRFPPFSSVSENKWAAMKVMLS